MVAPHTLGLLGQVRATLAHTTGFQHSAILAALYAGLLFVTWRAWPLLERPLARLWFRKWTYDSRTRDYHRVLGADHLGEMIDMTGHEQRRAKALITRRDRVRGLMLCFAFMAPAALQWVRSGHVFGSMTGLGVILIAIALPFAVGLPILLIQELLYQTGNQWVENPKELFDFPTENAGPDLVRDQKAHGDAKPAAAPDIGAVLAGARSSEPNFSFRK